MPRGAGSGRAPPRPRLAIPEARKHRPALPFPRHPVNTRAHSTHTHTHPRTLLPTHNPPGYDNLTADPLLALSEANALAAIAADDAALGVPVPDSFVGLSLDLSDVEGIATQDYVEFVKQLSSYDNGPLVRRRDYGCAFGGRNFWRFWRRGPWPAAGRGRGFSCSGGRRHVTYPNHAPRRSAPPPAPPPPSLPPRPRSTCAWARTARTA